MHVTDVAAVHAGLHKCVRWKQRCLLVVVSLLGVANAALAGTNTWTGVGPQGGWVYDLAFHPSEPSTMYVATSGGFYRSNDSGSSWQLTSADGLAVYLRPRALAVEASRPDRLYVASGFGSALRSEDRGVTLSVTSGQVSNNLSYADSQAIAAAADGSAIYYALDAYIYRSLDGGISRELRGVLPVSQTPVFSLDVDFSNPQVVYAATFEGVHRSADGGVNWATIFQGDSVPQITIDPRNSNRIWIATSASVRVSNDAGSTWQVVLPNGAADLDIDPRNSQIVFAALSDRRVLRTINGGISWTPLPVPEIGDDAYRSWQLAVHPADDARLYLFGQTGIFASADSGATWLRSDQGIMATSPGRFSPTAASSGHVFFPLSAYGIGALRPGDDTVDINLSPSLPNAGGRPAARTVLSLPTTLIAAFDNSILALSTDFGATWMPPVAPPPYTTSLAAARNGAWTVYAATHGGIYRSDDLGDHWSISSSGLPVASASLIAVAANQTHLYAALGSGIGGTDIVYRSVDGGRGWSPTALDRLGIVALAPHPSDAQTLLAGTGEGVFKTIDGGSTWQTLPLRAGRTDPISAIAIDPANPDIIYVDTNYALGNGIVRSVDAGATFQRLMPAYYAGDGAESLLVVPDQSHRVLAVVRGNGVMEMSIEPDLQLTIQPQAGSGTVNSPVEFTITATNGGPFDATGVQVEVQLPTGASATSATGNGSSCAIASNVVTCTVGILRLDQTIEILVRTTPTAAGSLVFNAAVTGAQPDNVANNSSASASVSITSVPPSNPGGGSSGGGGGGGGVFDAIAVLALLSISILGRGRRKLEA